MDVGEGIALRGYCHGVEGDTVCRGGIYAYAVVDVVFVKAARLDLVVAEISRQLIDDGSHHFHMAKLFASDVGQYAYDSAVGHCIALIQVPCGGGKLTVRTSEGGDYHAGEAGVWIGNLYRVLKLFFIDPHYFFASLCAPLPSCQGQGVLIHVQPSSVLTPFAVRGEYSPS